MPKLSDNGAKIDGFEHSLRMAIAGQVAAIVDDEIESAVNAASDNIRKRLRAELSTFAVKALAHFEVDRNRDVITIRVDTKAIEGMGNG